MDDDFETEECETEESVTPRKFDKATLFALYLQYKAHKKLVKGDWYASVASAMLQHREYKLQRTEFQESAGREIEALVKAVEGVGSAAAN